MQSHAKVALRSLLCLLLDNQDLRGSSYDWILKSSGFKGAHCLVWPDPLDSTSSPSLITDRGADKFNENAGLSPGVRCWKRSSDLMPQSQERLIWNVGAVRLSNPASTVD